MTTTFNQSIAKKIGDNSESAPSKKRDAVRNSAIRGVKFI